MLQAGGIKKRYGSVEVLKGVDISVNRGEIVSIVGSSGAGKSTLLHILGTLDKPDAGYIRLNETDLTTKNDKQLAAFRNRYIGFVFQFHHLLPEFTALENVCIPGWIADRPKEEVEKKAAELLAHLGLSNRADNKPAALSGGDQRPTDCICRRTLGQPRFCQCPGITCPVFSIAQRFQPDLSHCYPQRRPRPHERSTGTHERWIDQLVRGRQGCSGTCNKWPLYRAKTNR